MTRVTIAIGTDVDYARDQEFLPEPRGKPYLRPAMDENEDDVVKEISAVLKQQIMRAVL